MVFFFDIPVYRLSKDEYYSQRNKYIEQEMYSGPPEAINKKRELHKRYPYHKLSYEECLVNNYGGQWDYNEIIGFIRLHFVGNQIRGEYYSVSAKIITKTRKKQFEFKAWNLVNEIDIPIDSNNFIIFKIICDCLENCGKKLKKRYIDTSLFKVIGPHVDWVALMNTKSLKV
jgi:hypothetical protein